MPWELLRNDLEEGAIHARGQLECAPDTHPEVNAFWPPKDISAEFWRGTERDGGGGFRNQSRSERVPWLEVRKTELFERWPETERRPMPSPFDVDWVRLPDVVEAIKRLLNNSDAGACKHLFNELQRGALHPRRLSETGACQEIDRAELPKPSQLPRDPVARLFAAVGITQASDRREAIMLCRDEVIGLWPELVLSEFW